MVDQLSQSTAPVSDDLYDPNRPVDVCQEGLPEPPVDVSPPPPAERDWSKIDPPIEHDPIGQALIGLPVEIAIGAGEALVTSARYGATIGKEVVAWAIGEGAVAGVESAAEGQHEAGTGEGS